MKSRKRWCSVLALALITAGGIGFALPQSGMAVESSPYALSTAVYPQMAPYPDETSFLNEKTGEFDSDGFQKVFDAWSADQRNRRLAVGEDAESLTPFFTKSIQQFLSGAGTENRIYSPLNVYMALSMLTELTDGTSRQQILDLLGADSIEALRKQTKAIWTANYCDDGATTSILANSLWLNQDISFVPKTMQSLAKNYYASSFQGKMGSDDFNKALQTWLNEQTGGLLEEQANGVTLDPETILALATTVYFRAKWDAEFSENRTDSQTFHAASGDQTCDFMHQSSSKTYYWGDHFSAVSKSFNENGAMWFLLPDEGVSPEELLQDAQVMDFLLSKNSHESWENSKYLIVNLSVPKFDASSNLDLSAGLQSLGITDVFDSAKSDFSPMSAEADNVYLGKADHAARVTIDEQGCTAAAYTVMAACGTAMPPEEEVDFVLDRPFLFVINGLDGLPLFAGIVNQA